MKQSKPFLFYNGELTSALMELVDDDQLLDIYNYGMSQGFPGFIYVQETSEFFTSHEDSVEDVCYDQLGIDWLQQLSRDTSSIIELVQKMVWFTVETYVNHRLQYLNPLPNEVLSGNKPKSTTRISKGTELHLVK